MRDSFLIPLLLSSMLSCPMSHPYIPNQRNTILWLGLLSDAFVTGSVMQTNPIIQKTTNNTESMFPMSYETPTSVSQTPSISNTGTNTSFTSLLPSITTILLSYYITRSLATPYTTSHRHYPSTRTGIWEVFLLRVTPP